MLYGMLESAVQTFEQEGPGSPTRVLAHKMVYWPADKDISFKDNSIFSSVGHVVQLSLTF